MSEKPEQECELKIAKLKYLKKKVRAWRRDEKREQVMECEVELRPRYLDNNMRLAKHLNKGKQGSMNEKHQLKYFKIMLTDVAKRFGNAQ